LVLSFDDDLEEPYHIHMLEPHVQVGGVLTENTLPTLEYMVVDDEPGDIVTADVYSKEQPENGMVVGRCLPVLKGSSMTTTAVGNCCSDMENCCIWIFDL
jgi:hypothetical protein